MKFQKINPKFQIRNAWNLEFQKLEFFEEPLNLCTLVT